MWARRFDDPGARRLGLGEGAAVEVLAEGSSGQLAAIRVTVAAGARVGEHDHGSSEALLLPLAGRLILRGGKGEIQLAPGVVAFIEAGERVSVENPTEAPASMVVCFAPPAFVTGLLATAGTDGAADSTEAARAAA